MVLTFVDKLRSLVLGEGAGPTCDAPEAGGGEPTRVKELTESAPWLRTNGINANGAAAKISNDF